MDEVFKALADTSRRQLLDSLNSRNGQTLRELCSGLDMARQSVSKHLAVLEAANLVSAVRRGREKLHYLNPAPIREITERWINHYEQARVHALADLKRALEDPIVDRPTFVYTTYIRTTPERLWQALTDPAFTKRYWGATFDTDWQPGSAMRWDLGVAIDDPEQVVIDADGGRDDGAARRDDRAHGRADAHVGVGHEGHMAVDDRQARRLLRLADGALLDVAGPGDELVVDRLRHGSLASFCDNRAGVNRFRWRGTTRTSSLLVQSQAGYRFPYTPSVG